MAFVENSSPTCCVISFRNDAVSICGRMEMSTRATLFPSNPAYELGWSCWAKSGAVGTRTSEEQAKKKMIAIQRFRELEISGRTIPQMFTHPLHFNRRR